MVGTSVGSWHSVCVILKYVCVWVPETTLRCLGQSPGHGSLFISFLTSFLVPIVISFTIPQPPASNSPPGNHDVSVRYPRPLKYSYLPAVARDHTRPASHIITADLMIFDLITFKIIDHRSLHIGITTSNSDQKVTLLTLLCVMGHHFPPIGACYLLHNSRARTPAYHVLLGQNAGQIATSPLPR